MLRAFGEDVALHTETALLQEEAVGEVAKEEAASALWSLSAGHRANQTAVAAAGGIAPHQCGLQGWLAKCCKNGHSWRASQAY